MGKTNGLALAAAFIGGAVVGAAAGLLLAPEKGENTRKKVREALEKSGIKLDKEDLEALVTRVKNAVTSSDDDEECDESCDGEYDDASDGACDEGRNELSKEG